MFPLISEQTETLLLEAKSRKKVAKFKKCNISSLFYFRRCSLILKGDSSNMLHPVAFAHSVWSSE